MYGSGNSFIAEILKGSSNHVEFLRNTINPPLAARAGAVEYNLEELKRRVKAGGLTWGLPRWDADRIAAWQRGSLFIPEDSRTARAALHEIAGGGVDR